MLIRPGSVTHSFNMNQRAIELSTRVTAGKLQALAPNSNWIAPPGYYMLFVTSWQGVPSKAAWVEVPVYP